jgi:hypothetical protein
MSVQMVLLPVFVLVGLTFALLLWMAGRAARALVERRDQDPGYRAGTAELAERATQIGNCYRNQFELPLLFYILIALALPLRHADLFIVLMSWVFVVTRFAHAGIFVTSNDLGTALAGMVRRRAGAVRDVDLLRAEDSAADLTRNPPLSNLKVLNDSRCPAVRRHRTDRHHRHPARSGGEGAEGVGHRAPLCRLRRSRRDLRPGLGRAAPARLERLAHGRRHAARARARHAQARARHGRRCHRRAVRRRPLCAGAAERGRARRADLAFARRMRRRISPATIRNGSTISRAGVRR